MPELQIVEWLVPAIAVAVVSRQLERQSLAFLASNDGKTKPFRGGERFSPLYNRSKGNLS